MMFVPAQMLDIELVRHPIKTQIWPPRISKPLHPIFLLRNFLLRNIESETEFLKIRNFGSESATEIEVLKIRMAVDI